MDNPSNRKRNSGRIEIKGFLPVTLLDWPGKIAAMIFLGGCNFRCQFCYNQELVINPEKMPTIKEKDVFDYLKKKKNWLDGVVISGGEPTIHKKLPEFCQKIKKMDLGIQIQTNGTNPEMLEKLVKDKLVDYIAMDIKGPLHKYSQITDTAVDTKKIKKSIEIIKNNPKVDAEFRTTVVPGLIDKNNIKEMVLLIKDTDHPYYLQQFRNIETMNPKFKKQEPYLVNELKKMLVIAKKYYNKVELRGT